MRNLFLLLLVAYCCPLVAAKTSPECAQWFSLRKLKSTKDLRCLQSCEKIGSDLLSLGCFFECPDLCNFHPEDDHKRLVLQQIKDITIYYDLTPQERDLIMKDPIAALTVYIAKRKAEAVALNMFGRSVQLDESDAVRHFTWAMLICAELGPETATLFLNAHERTNEPTRDKAMDAANNAKGLVACKQLRAKHSKFDVDEILVAARNAYRAHELVILRPWEKANK